MATPRPLLRPRHDPSFDGISGDIPVHDEQLVVVFDPSRAVRRAEDPSASAMTTVEARRVAEVEALHVLGKLRFLDLDDEMGVSSHETSGKAEDSGLIACPSEPMDVVRPIEVISKEGSIPDGVTRDMEETRCRIASPGHRTERCSTRKRGASRGG